MPKPQDIIDRRVRVAVLTTSWPRDERDATGRFLANQVERLRAADCRVDVVAPRSSITGGFRDHGLAGGAGIVANAKRAPWRVPFLLFNMARAIRRAARHADVVHANWLLTAPIAALAGKPVVLTLHGSGTAGRFEDLRIAADYPWLFRWLVRRAAVVVGVSPLLADAARAAGARRVIEVPHGVDVPTHRLVERGDVSGRATDIRPREELPIALFAGRLSPEKGTETLARAFEGAHGEAPLTGVRLVVAGDGPERARLARIPGAELLGVLSSRELAAEYDRAALLVMPSLREGFGVVALEAMAHGVPVIAGSVGGLAALVQHEHTGLHVAPGSADELRAAVERLRDDPTLRGRLGEAA
ncbi:MAG: mfpsA, partial [Thermoleophilia bacterium]|nr:mfpsA [Thermoleophilia bacterium]